MPRRPKVFVEGEIYHFYDRFARGANLFSEPEEAIEFVEILRKVKDRDELRIFAWIFELLEDPVKGREISRTRYLIAALAIERWELTAKQLGELLGRRPEAVSRWAGRGAEMRMSSKGFMREYEALDQALTVRSSRPAARSQEREIVGPGTVFFNQRVMCLVTSGLLSNPMWLV